MHPSAYLLVTLLLLAPLACSTNHSAAQGYAIENTQNTNTTSASPCCTFTYQGTVHTCAAINPNDCTACRTACATYANDTP